MNALFFNVISRIRALVRHETQVVSRAYVVSTGDRARKFLSRFPDHIHLHPTTEVGAGKQRSWLTVTWTELLGRWHVI